MEAAVERTLEGAISDPSTGARSLKGVEELSRLFAPAVLFPSQFPTGRKSGAEAVPEKLLMLAVLDGAIRAYGRRSLLRRTRDKVAYAEARDWLESDDRSWPFSFLNICDALGFDPGYLRRGLGCGSDNTPQGGNGKLSVNGGNGKLSVNGGNGKLSVNGGNGELSVNGSNGELSADTSTGDAGRGAPLSRWRSGRRYRVRR